MKLDRALMFMLQTHRHRMAQLPPEQRITFREWLRNSGILTKERIDFIKRHEVPLLPTDYEGTGL